jgi:hypothetical protein
LLCACNTAPAPFAIPDASGTAGVVTPPGDSNVDASGSVASTSLEQLSLERINRSRLRPAAEAAMFGIALDEGIPGLINPLPKQPLAMNAMLSAAAKLHSRDMINKDYFEHVSPLGVNPFQRMNNAGYMFLTAGENIAWRGTTGSVNEVSFVEKEHEDLFVDVGIVGRGHRVSMLNADFREVGIAVVRGSFTEASTAYDAVMQTQDFGTSVEDKPIVLGVVYNDSNNNGRYDAGEGVANQTVTMGGTSKSTGSGGGYAFVVNQPGAYTIRFTSGRTVSVTLDAGDPNVKIDQIDNTRTLVNDGMGQLN